MKVLIAGGAGFIGSTIASAFIDAGIAPVILDNLITGRREFARDRIFYDGDIADSALIDRIFAEHHDISAAIHCAALIVVPDSVARPTHYYRENVCKTLAFVEGLLQNRCHRLIFSSSAAIYEPGPDFSVDESSRIAPTSPYARTKVVVEHMLTDIAVASALRVLPLRYFNPIGADPKMRTGLQIKSPSHILGKLIEARDTGGTFHVTGDDYSTRDGSGIRDYIHVWDLAAAHVAAFRNFDQLFEQESGGNLAINLGTGTGTTVFELVDAFRRVTAEQIPVSVAPRRPGDSVGAYTKSDRAKQWLGWETRMSIDEGIADTLEWFRVRGKVLPDLEAEELPEDDFADATGG